MQLISEEVGLGVIAEENFSIGESICEYPGDLISAAEGKRRWRAYSDEQANRLFFFGKFCLDPNSNLEVGAFINHSLKDPNLVVCRRNKKGKIPSIMFSAKRNIVKGEQLTYDYGDRNKDSVKRNPWLLS